MKFSYDSRYNIAYLRLQEKREKVTTIHISESINIDIAPDGTLYGIELLNANEQVFQQDANKFIIENKETGSVKEIAWG